MTNGKFIFEGIHEGEGDSLRQIYFNPPLKVDFSIYEKIDKETGKENYPEDVPLMGFFTFDFGMEAHVSLDVKQNWLVNGYEGLTPDSDPIDILRGTIMFDLFHAFFHIPQDTNYSHYNWALRGWLKERVNCKDFGDE
jgi:hypothetical protein